MLKECFSDMLNNRHGGFFALGDILLGLNGKGDLHNFSEKSQNSIFLKSLSFNE